MERGSLHYLPAALAGILPKFFLDDPSAGKLVLLQLPSLHADVV
jgi:hypothetical protein